MRERSARYVEDLSDGVAAPFEDGSFVLLNNDNYRTNVLLCQYYFRTNVPC